ncbi:hypothetical protein PAXINDRAFT_86505, partial [Paxillus involutus ATCC 200175]
AHSRTCNDLESGKLPMTAEDLPAFLWSGERPGDDYNPENKLSCLFKSYYLVHVAQHIFLGSSSALGGDSHATRSCNVVLHDMSSVDAEHIAYTCIQARFSVVSKSTWSEKDSIFSYLKFYRTIVSLILDATDKRWRNELLKWWNMYVVCSSQAFTCSANKLLEGNYLVMKMDAKMPTPAVRRLLPQVPVPPQCV